MAYIKCSDKIIINNVVRQLTNWLAQNKNMGMKRKKHGPKPLINLVELFL